MCIGTLCDGSGTILHMVARYYGVGGAGRVVFVAIDEVCIGTKIADRVAAQVAECTRIDSDAGQKEEGMNKYSVFCVTRRHFSKM